MFRFFLTVFVIYSCVFAHGQFIENSSIIAPQLTIDFFSRQNISQFGLQEDEFVLTFDDGPNSVTPAVLDVLRHYNIKAVFFVLGSRVPGNRDILERMANEGHNISNHTYTHRSDYKTARKLVKDIMRAHNSIEPYMRQSQTERWYFRSPFGIWNSWRADNLNEDRVIGRYIGPIFWNIGGELRFKKGQIYSSADWNCWSKKLSVSRCAKGYLKESLRKRKGVVLFHDVRAQTAELLERYLKLLIENRPNARFLTLDELPELDQYEGYRVKRIR